jgi:hypothetical protein
MKINLKNFDETDLLELNDEAIEQLKDQDYKETQKKKMNRNTKHIGRSK